MLTNYQEYFPIYINGVDIVDENQFKQIEYLYAESHYMGTTATEEKYFLIKIRDDFAKISNEDKSGNTELYRNYFLSLQNHKNQNFLTYYGLYYNREHMAYFLIFECPSNTFNNMIQTAMTQDRLIYFRNLITIYYYLLTNNLKFPLLSNTDYFYISSHNTLKIIYLGNLIDENMFLLIIFYNDILEDYRRSICCHLTYYNSQFNVNCYKEYLNNNLLFTKFLIKETSESIKRILWVNDICSNEPGKLCFVDNIPKNEKIFFLDFMRRSFNNSAIDLIKEYQKIFTIIPDREITFDSYIESLKISKLNKIEVIVLSDNEEDEDIVMVDQNGIVKPQIFKSQKVKRHKKKTVKHLKLNSKSKFMKISEAKCNNKKFFEIVQIPKRLSIDDFMDKYFNDKERYINDDWLINPKDIPILGQASKIDPILKPLRIWDPCYIPHDILSNWLHIVFKEWPNCDDNSETIHYYEDIILAFLKYCEYDMNSCGEYIKNKSFLFTEFLKFKNDSKIINK